MKKISDHICYVYEHWRPDKDICFYVGKGHAYRFSNLDAGRNKYHRNIVEKVRRLGMEIEIRFIALNLTHDEACKLEQERILFWRSTGIKLVNMTDGGDGAGVGRIVSKETREKLSLAQKNALQHPEKSARIRDGLIRAKDKKSLSVKKARANYSIEKRQLLEQRRLRSWRATIQVRKLRRILAEMHDG